MSQDILWIVQPVDQLIILWSALPAVWKRILVLEFDQLLIINLYSPQSASSSTSATTFLGA